MEPELSPEDQAMIDAMEAPKVSQGIKGRVVDAKSGDAMIEAQVTVIQTGKKVLTDLDGNFALDLPPGTYSLRSFYELYEAQRVDNIVVKPGETTTVDIKLGMTEEAELDVEEVVITARADKATDATQLQIRKETASVRDAISAQEITRSGSNNAADAVRRVVSATVDPSNRLIVRGLGSRYTRVLLHGFRIPSTDPDDPGVELDLFPAGVLSNLAVLKTFTPDLPGDFAGGIMQIETRDFPQDFMLQANVSLGYNTEATFRDVLDYQGGKRDWLGFDDGTRELPDSVGDERLSKDRSIVDGMVVEPNYTADELNDIARDFDNTWNIEPSTGLPNMSLGIVAGDTVDLGKHDLGYLAAFGYSYRTERRVSTVKDPTTTTGGEPNLEELAEYTDERGRRIGSWGALGTLNYDLAEGHDLTLTNLFSQSGTDEVNFADGVGAEAGVPFARRRLRWYERQLWFSQLRGEHRMDLLKGFVVDWNGSVARAERDEPDTRSIRYAKTPGSDRYQFAPGGVSPQRLFSNYNEWTVGSQLDFALSIIEQLKLKVGAQTRHQFAEFRVRRFLYGPLDSSSDDNFRSPESLLAPDNIGTVVDLEETTRAQDGFDAQSGSYAGYGMLDAAPFRWLRVVGGIRAEFYRQILDVESPTGPPTDIPRAVHEALRDDPAYLPSGALIFTLAKEMYLRASYGKTVARPLFRELSPAQYEDEIRGIITAGNPALKSATIHNVDLRWEMFPAQNEVLAVTGFYKQFIDPIEPYLSTSAKSYQNAKGATNIGGELEGRLGLDRLHDALEGFVLGGNFTYVKSEIELEKDPQVQNTSKKRPLAGQSPYVANLSLGFSDPDSGSSLFAYYNVFGKRIDTVGALEMPDQYEQPFHSLDLIGNYNLDKHWALRLNAKNLLFSETRLKIGSLVREQYNPGTIITVGAGYAY